jgi:methionine sulfoxide reductase heme-binding subunit
MTLVEWYVARAGGMVAFGLLTVTVVAGLTLSGRAQLRTWPRFAVEDIHRFLGLLTGTFIFIHVFALFIDSYMPFSLSQIIVPGAAAYRPLATALGTVSAELLLAIAVTNHYRQRLPYGFWRRAHYFTFAVWLFALIHGLLAGSDSGSAWATAIYVTAAGLVPALVVWRVSKPPAKPAEPARPQRTRRVIPAD